MTAILFLGVYQEIWKYVHKKTCTWMSTEAAIIHSSQVEIIRMAIKLKNGSTCGLPVAGNVIQP